METATGLPGHETGKFVMGERGTGGFVSPAGVVSPVGMVSPAGVVFGSVELCGSVTGGVALRHPARSRAMKSPAVRRQTRIDHLGLGNEANMGNTTPLLTTLCTGAANNHTRGLRPSHLGLQGDGIIFAHSLQTCAPESGLLVLLSAAVSRSLGECGQYHCPVT